MRPIFRKAPSVSERTWVQTSQARVFLVDAPLTFGHSQLVVPKTDAQFEEEAFHAAAPLVEKCIRIFRLALSSAVASHKPLARYTNTTGSYQKTLVLKVSASETSTEYKIHLVPVFKSHLDSANCLHQKTHNVSKGKAGGLLHWIGKRELIVDRDTLNREDPKTIERIKAFRLDDLALVLGRAMRRRRSN